MNVQLILGDCLEKMKEIETYSVDSIVTDPPYELGFMGKSWDSTGIANNVEMWKECLRVLKPGGHLLAFSGTRTYHRMASAIEDAGFEVRDMIEWVYGSGFPKSLNISKAIEATEKYGKSGTRTLRQIEQDGNGESYELKGKNNGILGETRIYDRKRYTPQGIAKQWEGWGTALKPAHEPICMARKPLSEKSVAENCLKWGTGGINIDESRVGTEEMGGGTMPDLRDVGAMSKEATGIDKLSFGQNPRPATRKEQPTYIGRFPANLILSADEDGQVSEEVRECFPDTGKGNGKGAYSYAGREYDNKDTSMFNGDKPQAPSNFNDNGNASRFFKSIIYQAKASKSERNRGCEDLEEKQYSHDGREKEIENPYQRNKSVATNNHPTVKPIALMEYLINMVTPKGGTVLDPFMGSGTTGVACKKLSRNFIGIEIDSEYLTIAQNRIAKL